MKSSTEVYEDAVTKEDGRTMLELQNPFVTSDTPDFITETTTGTVYQEEEQVEEGQATPEEQSHIFETVGQNFQTPGDSLTAGPPSPITDSGPAKSVIDRIDFKKIDLFGYGAFAGILSATIVACFFRQRRSRKKKSKRLKPWTNQINFNDECESNTDDSYDSIEDGNMHLPIDYEHDWLGGVGFEKKIDEGLVNPFVFAEKAHSDSSSSYGEDEDAGLFGVLNGESSNSQRSSSLTLDSPPRSPPDSPPLSPTNLLLSPEMKIPPPTVSELFQNTLSSRLRLTPPLSVSSSSHCSSNSGGSGGTTDEKLAKEQETLNKSLFLLNDQILEQQRDLELATKARSEKATLQGITEMIHLLQAKKDEVVEKLKNVRTKVKLERRRLERHRKRFQNK